MYNVVIVGVVVDVVVVVGLGWYKLMVGLNIDVFNRVVTYIHTTHHCTHTPPPSPTSAGLLWHEVRLTHNNITKKEN